MNAKRISITSEAQSLLFLALPLILSQLVQAGSGFIGTAMVARLGPDAVAASGIVMITWLTLSVVCFGIINATSVLTAHQLGAKEHRLIGIIFRQALILAVLLSIPVCFLVWNEPYLLRWSGQDHQVVLLATQYLHTLVWCMPPLSIIIVTEQLLIGLGRTRLVLWISLIQIPFEIFANYCFIFGKFGLPAMGIKGLGYGFTLVFVIAAMFILLYLGFSKLNKTYFLFAEFPKWRSRYIKEMFRVGWPIGAMFGIEVGAFAVVAFLMGRFGGVVLAAHQIVMQYLGLTITIVFALSQAVTVRVGHGVGANNLDQVKRSAKVGLGFSLIAMCICALFYTVFVHQMLVVDLNKALTLHSPTIRLAIAYLAIVAIFQVFDSQRIVLAGILRGLKDTRIPMFISFVAFWLIGLALAIIFGDLMSFQGVGVWWALTLGVASGAIILFIRLQRILKQVDLAALSKIP